MILERAQNAREESPGQVGDWRHAPLFGSVPALHGSQLPPRAPRNGEWGTIQNPSNISSPSMHPPFQWGQPRGVVRPQSLYLPGQSPPVPLNQSQPVSQSPQIHQRRPRSGCSSLQKMQGIQQWLDRATVANQKAKEIFSLVSKVCSPTDCSASDVQRLISISFEQLVRNLDYIAATKALKAAAIQERLWSTEPNGQGFRMAGKEAKGYIDKNSIDPTRLIYSVTEDGLNESRPAHTVAEESVIEQQQASSFRQAAKDAAIMADIPLYTVLDNFLQQAERQYAIEGEKALSSGRPPPAVVPQSIHAQDAGLEISPEIPSGGPSSRAQGHYNAHEGTNPPSYAQGNGCDLPPILVKEGFLVSTGTFDRRSHNTWNDLSPRFDGGITNLPWSGHEEIMVSGPAIAVMAGGVLDDFNLPGDGTLIKDSRPAKSRSSTKDGDGRGVAGGTTGDSRNPAPEGAAEKSPSSIPSCFCGITCERKDVAGCMAYFGCKHSKCPAQIPIEEITMPNSNNDDSGTLIKVSPEANGNPSKKKRRGASSLPAMHGGDTVTAKKKGCAEHGTKANIKLNPRVNSKGKNRTKASPKRKRKGDNDVASSPDGPRRNPVRKSARKVSDAKANKSKLDDAASPRVTSTDMTNFSSPKAKRPPGRPARLGRPPAAAVGSPTKAFTEDMEQSIERMIEEELALLPAGMRCRKSDPYGLGRICLQSLRPGIDGSGPSSHVGRCRFKPRNARKLPRGVSEGPKAFGGSNTGLPPKTSPGVRPLGKATHDVPLARPDASNAGQVDDLGHSRGGAAPSDDAASEDDPTELVDTRAASALQNELGIQMDAPNFPGASRAPPHSHITSVPAIDTEQTEETGKDPQSEVNMGGREEAARAEEAEGAERAEGYVSTARSDSGNRLSESIKLGKPHWDGQGVLHREFVALSVKKIAVSYGCSSVLPHSVWVEQKKEFVSQCEALQANPMLHAAIIGETDFVGGCSVDPQDPKDASPPAYEEEATGLFASEHMKAGSPVAELIGETVSVAEAKRREGEYASLIASGGLTLANIVGDNRGHLEQPRGLMFNLNDSWVLDATRAGSSARFARRTKDGNCRLAVVNEPAGATHVYLQAISDLSKDEEITIQSV